MGKSLYKLARLIINVQHANVNNCVHYLQLPRGWIFMRLRRLFYVIMKKVMLYIYTCIYNIIILYIHVYIIL